MNRKSLAALVVLAVSGAPAASAAGVTASLEQTMGSSNYRGTTGGASVDIGDSLYLAPSFSTFRSDSSGGTFTHFYLRGGYESGPLSLGAHGGFLPKKNGYGQTSAGADVTFSLTPGGSKHGRRMAGASSGGSTAFGSGLGGVDIGGGINQIVHTQDFAGAGLGRRGKGAALGTKLTLGQTDLTAFAGAKVLMIEAGGSVTKSVYSKDLAANNARAAQFLTLSGFGAVVQGFPDTSTNLKLTMSTLPLVRPYASYTRTTFKDGASASNAYEGGASVGLDMLSVKGSVSRYVQSGFPDQNFFTLGASLYF